jgi:hypothetical protein
MCRKNLFLKRVPSVAQIPPIFPYSDVNKGEWMYVLLLRAPVEIRENECMSATATKGACRNKGDEIHYFI